MRGRIKATGLALVVVAAGLACGAKAQSPTVILGVPVPDRVGGLTHQRPENFEKNSPGMGYGVRFDRPDWTIDVFIYDLRTKGITDDPNSAAVQSAVTEAKGEIEETARRGDYAKLAVTDTFSVADASGHTRFVCTEYNYFHKRRSVDLDSYLCLAGARGEFFQVRMDTTKPGHPADETRRVVQAFLVAWMPILWP
jgi:hypothetical protein